MKKLFKMCLVGMLAISLCACSSEDSGLLQVGVIQYAEHSALDATYEGFVAGLNDNGYVDGETIEIDFQNAQGEQANCESIADKFVNNQSDLIFAIATLSAQAAAVKTSDIPIVISAVTDPASSGLVVSNEEPGGNVTGSSDLTPVAEQLELLVELLPDTQTVAVMYTSSEDNSIFQAQLAMDKLDEMGLDYVVATVSDSSTIQQVTESLIGKVDAIYIPTDNLLAEYMTTVAMVANENGLPVITGESGMVEAGGLATYGLDYYEIGYLAGVQAAAILNGDSVPAEMPIEYLSRENCELTINTAVAAQLGIEISDELLAEAILVGE